VVELNARTMAENARISCKRRRCGSRAVIPTGISPTPIYLVRNRQKWGVKSHVGLRKN